MRRLTDCLVGCQTAGGKSFPWSKLAILEEPSMPVFPCHARPSPQLAVSLGCSWQSDRGRARPVHEDDISVGVVRRIATYESLQMDDVVVRLRSQHAGAPVGSICGHSDRPVDVRENDHDCAPGRSGVEGLSEQCEGMTTYAVARHGWTFPAAAKSGCTRHSQASSVRSTEHC